MPPSLLSEIKKCELCKEHLPFAPNPIVQFSKTSRILIVGQAPGILAHQSSTPWNDKSGERLREWLQIGPEQFYDPELVAIVPMGFCYPGKGKSGDLPPRKECAPRWMELIRDYLKQIDLEIYIGKYACDYFFGKKTAFNKLIQNQAISPDQRIALPHPSPRNNIWLAKNSWFEKDVLPKVRNKIKLARGEP